MGGREKRDGKGSTERGWKERHGAPCSPSDALLKVKVFRPSLTEREREREKAKRREEGKREREREREETYTRGITTMNVVEDGLVIRGMERERLVGNTYVGGRSRVNCRGGETI